MAEEIHSGWLTKSPGSKKVTIFANNITLPIRAKWRKRFFCLYKPKGGQPGEYQLSYYKDKSKSHKYGSINLKDCEKIQAALDSTYYPHLFCIETTSKRQSRIYYLAAEYEEEMMTWVEKLCHICNLSSEPKPEDNNRNGAEIEEIRQSEVSYLADNDQHIQEEIARNRLNGVTYDKAPVKHAPPPPKEALDQNPVPVSRAPFRPPPHRTPSHLPSTHRKSSLTSPVPLPRNINSIHSASSRVRDEFGSSSSSNGGRSGLTRSNVNSQCSSNDGQETYEAMSPTASTRSSVRTANSQENPPPRPPTYDQLEEQEDYVNFTTLEREHKRSIDEHYDIPKNWSASAPPPPCIGLNDKVHKYINASTQIVKQDNEIESYSHAADNNNLGNMSSSHGIDLNMQVRPSNDEPRQPLTCRNPPSGYLPMDQQAQEDYTAMDGPPPLTENEDEDFYDVAPPSRPVDHGNHEDDDVYDIAPPSRPVAKKKAPPPTPYTRPVSEDVYDVAPPTRPVHNSKTAYDRPDSDVYDVAPPSRPVGKSRVPPPSAPQKDRPDSDVYDVVPQTRALAIKPTHTVPNQRPESEDVYDVAPPTRPLYNNTRPESDGDIYDVAPPSRPVQAPRRNSPPVSDDIYDVAPPTRPVPPKSGPSRPPKPKPSQSGEATEGGVRIKSTARTMSFTRDSVFSDSESFDMPDHVMAHLQMSSEIKLPQRRDDNSSSDETVTSEDEEGDDSVYDVPPPRPNVLPAAPPAPAARNTGAYPIPPARPQAPGRPMKPNKPFASPPVEYVELSYNNNYNDNPISPKPRKFSASMGSTSSPPVEYTDINMMKTEALTATRKERKNLH